MKYPWFNRGKVPFNNKVLYSNKISHYCSGLLVFLIATLFQKSLGYSNIVGSCEQSSVLQCYSAKSTDFTCLEWNYSKYPPRSPEQSYLKEYFKLFELKKVLLIIKSNCCLKQPSNLSWYSLSIILLNGRGSYMA